MTWAGWIKTACEQKCGSALRCARWFEWAVPRRVRPVSSPALAATPGAASPVPIAASGSAEQANEVWKTETSGLGISVGIGSQYTFLGAQAAYYVQLPRSRMRVAPYAAIGAHCGSDDCTTGKMFGLLGSWGRKHRLLVDMFAGTVTARTISAHGESGVTQGYWGMGIAAGYEYMTFDGFFVRGDRDVIVAASNDESTVEMLMNGIDWSQESDRDSAPLIGQPNEDFPIGGGQRFSYVSMDTYRARGLSGFVISSRFSAEKAESFQRSFESGREFRPDYRVRDS